VTVYQTKRTSTIGYARVEKESSVAHNVEVPGDPIKQVYKVWTSTNMPQNVSISNQVIQIPAHRQEPNQFSNQPQDGSSSS